MSYPTHLEKETRPFDWAAQHRLDFENGDCVTLWLDIDDRGKNSRDSRERVRYEVERLLSNETYLKGKTQLYVLGEWVYSFEPDNQRFESGENLYDETRRVTRQEKEWNEAVGFVCKLIKGFPYLHELTWISGLPFTEAVWKVLPHNLKKLVIDVSSPVQLDVTDANHEICLSSEEMTPLVNYTNLEELRILGMRSSYQSIIWETVYRSKCTMKVLDLQMAAEPLVRQEGWIKAYDVVGLNVPKDKANAYKYDGFTRGLDGKGLLHYKYGTGEYLDDLCIRKARIASGLDRNQPIPLVRLKLNGFVVDNLPFGKEGELRTVSLLYCGNNCIDAGLRPPKVLVSSTMWNDFFMDRDTHSMIVFPNWIGIFDAKGNLLDSEGNVVAMPRREELSTFDGSSKERAGGVSLTLSHLLQMSVEEEAPERLDSLSVPDNMDTASIDSTRGGSEAPSGGLGTPRGDADGNGTVTPVGDLAKPEEDVDGNGTIAPVQDLAVPHGDANGNGSADLKRQKTGDSLYTKNQEPATIRDKRKRAGTPNPEHDRSPSKHKTGSVIVLFIFFRQAKPGGLICLLKRG
ncbi:hypothetical protein GQ43DRAFT_427662 [Delitschia confertaspora ATCC 74209]|uniref:Uncharacterized protein n=1 Tax=Delitschia confertaspora ATCC 74209 TaxID=1513339 RepID=A0A9P4MTY7_9PLEO|nr:hypothetical protein GQ43DRAFT_427662 [Delitschia confertaspora ATCC 74209]